MLCGVVLSCAANPLAAQETMAAGGPEVIEVSPDNQIVNNSRGGVANGAAPAGEVEPGPGAWSLGDGCGDLTACVHHAVSRGGLCGAPESLELVVTNKCPQPAAVGVCAERVDGGWECAVHKKLPPGKAEKHAMVLCHATGRYNVRATKATDLARDAECLRVGAALPTVTGVVPPAPAPQDAEDGSPPAPPGACSRAKACCRALSGIEGMHTLDNACAQMNSLDDRSGGPVCQQIMLLIQGTITPLPRIPGPCR